MSWSEFARDYLAFTRKERIGIVVILLVILFVMLASDVLRTIRGSKLAVGDTSWMVAAEKLMLSEKDSNLSENNKSPSQSNPYQQNHSNFPTVFYFDPNKISADDWKRLGVREKTIHTIENYLARGGHFGNPDDLKKIYGLHEDEVKRLKPYVRIESSMKPDRENNNEPGIRSKPAENSKKMATIDINSADTTAFISLPGIGSKLASRIVNFRDRLGGFYSIDQIAEIYGLPDSTFQRIKSHLVLQNSQVKKININIATKDEMKNHPYIKWNLANAIVEYRNQHGNYSSLEDLKKVALVTDEVFNKIKTYLQLQ
jgi:competence protein ComEA